MVGRANLNPEYVLFKMTDWEITAILNELNDREKERLEEYRFKCYLNAAPFYDSNGKVKEVSLYEFMPFAWDKKEIEIEFNESKDFEISLELCKRLST